MPKVLKLILTHITLILLFLSFNGLVYAFGSSSTNYKLEGEFGNFGGAKSSTNYTVSDTGGGFAPGYSNSTNYSDCSGFQCVAAQVPKISLTLSTNSINLGSLSSLAVNTQSHTATVTTNFQGYTLTVLSDGDLRYGSNIIDPVVSSPISAGTKAYGLATSKTGQDITQDTSCGSAPYNATALSSVTPKTVASSTSPTSAGGDQTTVCYSASIDGATAAGIYTQLITFIATGTF